MPPSSAPSTEPTPPPGLLVRLFLLAWVAYFRTIFDPEFAAGIVRLREGRPALPPPLEVKTELKTIEAPKKKKEEPAPVVLREATPDAALQLLALLQREGRLVDFLEEDVAQFADAQIGAAARAVHEGCRKALREHVPLAPIRTEEEGTSITLAKGYDAKSIRITGNVTGDPPFKGKVAHRGWRALEVKLAKMSEGHDASVIAPAEVEL